MSAAPKCGRPGHLFGESMSMANLWRVLAITWLGGVASPALAEDLTDIDTSTPVSIVGEPAATNAAVEPEYDEFWGHSAGVTGGRMKASEE